MVPTSDRLTTTNAAIDLLKRKLGRNAHVLDYIPLNKVELKLHNTGYDGYARYGIPIATVEDKSGKQWAAWALMSTTLRKDGSQELWIYAIEAGSKAVKRYNLADVINEGKLRQEFQLVKQKKRELIAVLKACFILKSGHVPKDIAFASSFLRDLRRACRMYKDDDTGADEDHITNDLDDTTEISTSSPNPEPTPKSSPDARRSSPPEASFPLSWPITERGHFEESKFHSATNRCAKELIVEQTPSYKETLKKASFFDVGDISRPQPPRLKTASPISQISTVVANENGGNHHTPSSQPYCITTATSITRAPKNNLDSYLELHEKQGALSSELRNINGSIEKHDANLQIKHKRQREELDAKHKEEIAEQYREQAIEADARKEELIQLKVKLAQQKDELLNQQRAQLQAKNAIREEVDHKRESFTREELLKMVDGLTPFALKRKRKRGEDGECVDGEKQS
ncbi:uncharacterized protein K460DRAFT_329116 [Cucurbitaria berberidis CBS 394.84]|uniref:Uncharacterized protein n=1 Tax=Cucurbitaria berberidis CBS 394.84 TaxID=1168544 RepID=A0A9P4LDX8_9PLEO|nr:uncharacterized protein K460DRAFT_329116 [Cucurbitaria berberidis CBS 394.84]KAF1851273.1 hypothetical protein K460DRAFT_329116 [Cucurbitaria berberidis CBS 394.84]